jgi:hypothetical protein
MDNSQIDLVATAKSIILANTRKFGPSPITGGTIHIVDDATAQLIAELVVQYAPEYGHSIAFILAGLDGESLFDPKAINPNFQDGKKGESADATFMHTDLGEGQFDGSTLKGDPKKYPEFVGLTDEEIEAKAMDPRWAVPAFCSFVRDLRVNTLKELANEPTLLDNVPNHDWLILATTAYNSGLQGAMHLAHTAGSFAYGVRWIANRDKFAAILQEPQ